MSFRLHNIHASNLLLTRMATLTIFTPAYNRAHTIGRTYESLCRQTCKDFEWLVVDDGSSDNTRELVEGWINEGKIRIRYIYQKNQGMHGAHNTAYDNITTELNTCIDSDDYMPDDAVEKIVGRWKSLTDEQRAIYAGMVGLDIDDKHKKVIGSEFPKGLTETTLSAYYNNGGTGDKKLVYRTDVVNKYPRYPIFEGERYVGLAVLYTMIDQDYKLLVMNEPLVVVEYQLDGSSFNMYRQYWNNPRGFSYLRKVDMKYALSFKRKFMSCIHYVSSSIRCGNKKFLKESPAPLLTILAMPFGAMLYLLIKHKVQTNAKYKVDK